MRFRYLLLLVVPVGCLSVHPARSQDSAYAIVRQPIHDYNLDFKEGNPRSRNEIPTVTRIGTDYGRAAYGKSCDESERNVTNCFTWRPKGYIRASLPTGVEWCAAFHCVDGLCGDWREGVRLDHAYSPIIEDAYRPRIIGLYAKVRAQVPATFKMELHQRKQNPFVESEIRSALYRCQASDEFCDIVWPGFSFTLENGAEVSEGAWQRAIRNSRGALRRNERLAICTWVLEKGGPIDVGEFGYVLAYPRLSSEHRWFLKSFAKLARCYDPKVSLVSDRAHFPSVTLTNTCVEGKGGRPVTDTNGRPICVFRGMDSIPSTGLFCLSSAVAAEDGIVTKQTAIDILKRAVGTVDALRHPKYGILPHFARIVAGDPASGWTYARIPDSEYSTVDTALYYFSTLLAADCLDQSSVRSKLLDGIAAIDFDALTAPNGFVSHGIATNGVTLLHEAKGGIHTDETVWRHWGGETALVLILKKANQLLRAGRATPSRNMAFNMDKDGTVYHGRGFIAEVQSLFFPQFARSDPDAISGVNWSEARGVLLGAQQSFFRQPAWSETDAGRLDLYGLSAGEVHPDLFGLPDMQYPYTNTYASFGTRLEDRRDTNRLDTARNGRVIHPHYVLMSYLSGDDAQRSKARKALETMEGTGLFPPFGMVEAFSTADVSKSLALFSALNAGFETIAAYHIQASEKGKTDLIYQAAGQDGLLAMALHLLYP